MGKIVTFAITIASFIFAVPTSGFGVGALFALFMGGMSWIAFGWKNKSKKEAKDFDDSNPVLNQQHLKNYYAVLEISPNASEMVIRAAYKSLMQHYHPDKNSGDPEMERKTIIIREAFDVLSDREKRKAYDLEFAQKEFETNNFHEKSSSSNSETMSQKSEQPTTMAQLPNGAKKFRYEEWSYTLLFLLFILFIVKNSDTSQNKPDDPVIQQQFTEENDAAKIARLVTEKEAALENERKEIQSKIALTIPKFAVNVIVKMPPSDELGSNSCSKYEVCKHSIKIPIIGLLAYKHDSEKVIQNIQKNKSIIISNIKRRLAKHSYTELITVNGSSILSKILLDEINESVIGKFDSYQHRIDPIGVQEILLPESFSIQ